MRGMVIGILLAGSIGFGYTSSDNKETKWALKDHAVDTFSMIPLKKSDDKFAPPSMMFDLTGKSKSIVVSLCGPKLTVEIGADLSAYELVSLSVERLDNLGWFGSVSQVVGGKVILRVNTGGEKDFLEKEIKEFQEKHSCNNF